MITPPANLLLRIRDACRRRTVDPVSAEHVIYLFLLRDIGPATIRTISDLTGLAYGTVAKGTECLESSGLVSAPRHCHRRTPRLWSLTPQGRGFLAGIDL